MKLTVHDNAASFLEIAAAFLSRAEAENSVIANPAARMAAEPRDDDRNAYLASVSDGARVIGVALQLPSGKVMVSAAPASAMAKIAEDMMRRERRAKGVVGPMASCEAFAYAWNKASGDAHVLRFHLRHFELQSAPACPVVAGCMRMPAPPEYDLICDWQTAFAAEAHLDDEATRHRDNAARRIAAGESRVWDDGGVVSYASYGGDGDTARIAPVYTPPEFRGSGYASALVAGISRELFEQGKRVIFLTTDVANPVSNRIYQRIGYRPVADYFHFDFVALAS